MHGTSKGSISFTYHDDERSVDYELLVSYTAYAAERQTWDYPGAPAFAEYNWQLVEAVDWSYDRERGIVLSFHAEEWDADGLVQKWLQKQLECDAVNRAIVEQCLADAGEREESARDAAAEERFELRRQGDFT